MVIELDENFQDTLSREAHPYVLEIYTEDCNTCKLVMPVVEQVEDKYGVRYAFYKLDAQKMPEVAEIVSEVYGVNSVPTLLFIKEGKVVSKLHDYVTKEHIVHELKKIAEPDAPVVDF